MIDLSTIPPTEPLRIIIGAGEQRWDGWIPTHKEQLDLLDTGPADHPAADHKIVFDYRLLGEVFASAGFDVDLLEYCDESGRFHYNQWALASGPVYRSLLMDHRNRDGRLGFVSLILDARKPSTPLPAPRVTEQTGPGEPAGSGPHG